MASPSKSKVCFFFDKTNPALRSRTALKQFITSIFKKERKSLESLNFVFCTDKKLLEINREWLKHDEYTDIISFDLSETEAIKGEIYISVTRVKENATKHGFSFNKELHRVIFHGVIHLCGYKDKNPSEIRLMRAQEDKYLSLYFNS
jgi:probable rRNA maturation factor